MATATQEPRISSNGVVPPTPEDEKARSERAWHEWVLIGVGLTTLLSMLAIILSVVALSSKSSDTTRVVLPAVAAATGGSAAAATPAVAPVSMAIAIKTDTEHGKLGPGGTWHDAFLPANFTVKPGQKVTVTFSNYDGGPHSFTSPAMGVQERIAGGGTATSPTVTTITFTAPKTPGAYQWWCALPCDPWAMKHNGYMRGIVTVKA